MTQVVKLRLRPILADTFRDVDYSPSEDEYYADAARRAGAAAGDGDDADADAGHHAGDADEDPVARRFDRGWDQLMRPIGRLLTAKTYAALLDLTARHLARVLEKRVWGYAGRTSAFGAVRLERDLSGMVSAVARENYGVRELFARLSQMLMLMNMEDDEWDEMAGPAADKQADAFVWALTEDERAKARTLVRPS